MYIQSGTPSLHAVAEMDDALSYKPEVRGFDLPWCHWNLSLAQTFRPQFGTGFDSASNRNEYQEYFLWVKAALRRADDLTTFMWRLSWNLRTLTLENSRPAQGLLNPVLPLHSIYVTKIFWEFLVPPAHNIIPYTDVSVNIVTNRLENRGQNPATGRHMVHRHHIGTDS
jgi:hypothetical protein